MDVNASSDHQVADPQAQEALTVKDLNPVLVHSAEVVPVIFFEII